MRQRIKIYTDTATSDSNGDPLTEDSGETKITNTRKHAKRIAAKVETVTGGETIRGRQIVSGVTKLFTIRYRKGLDDTQKIEYAGKDYGIVLVSEPDYEGNARYLEIQAKHADGH